MTTSRRHCNAYEIAASPPITVGGHVEELGGMDEVGVSLLYEKR